MWHGTIVELKNKTKSSKGSGIETDQAQQLDTVLNQSAKALNKNCDTEETDASTTSRWDNRSPSPFDSKAKITMAEKRDTNLITSGQHLEMTGTSKSIIEPQ